MTQATQVDDGVTITVSLGDARAIIAEIKSYSRQRFLEAICSGHEPQPTPLTKLCNLLVAASVVLKREHAVEMLRDVSFRSRTNAAAAQTLGCTVKRYVATCAEFGIETSAQRKKAKRS